IRRTPGLSCRMDQQLHYGSGRDQVAPGKPGTVEKNELFLIEPGLQQKLLHRRRAALKGSSLASQFAGETQGKLRVKGLAGLINDAHIFDQRDGDVFRQNLRGPYSRRRPRQLIKELGNLAVAGPRLAGDGDTAALQETSEDLRGKLRRVLDGQRLLHSRVSQRNAPPHHNLPGPCIAMDTDFARDARSCSNNAVLDFVVAVLRL